MYLNPQKSDDWDKLGQTLLAESADKILEYASKQLRASGEIVFLTAFGPEGCVILEILHKLKIQNISIANLNTGYQFAQSLELKNQLETKYQLQIQMIEPDLTIDEQNQKYGNNLYNTEPDLCCYLRKLVPLNNLLKNKYAWISSIRKEQTEIRAKAKIIEYDQKFKLGKINPLINWTKSDIWQYIHENQIPYNPLLDQGYESIGCEPCTQPGLDRKGRWAGKDKIECGLHIQDSEQEQGGEFVI